MWGTMKKLNLIITGIDEGKETQVNSTDQTHRRKLPQTKERLKRHKKYL